MKYPDARIYGKRIGKAIQTSNSTDLFLVIYKFDYMKLSLASHKCFYGQKLRTLSLTSTGTGSLADNFNMASLFRFDRAKSAMYIFS